LKNVEQDTVMTVKQKNDFKAVLTQLVYGLVNNIPDDEKTEIIDNPPKEESSSFGNIIF
jgi:hypothetical protein